jgi:RHS repeat-associated protein
MPVTNYIWDEVNDTLLMEKDEDGNTMASYTYEPGRYGPLISQHRGGQSSYYQFDGQGSRRQLTDANQNVTDSAVYTAFGETVACSGTTTNPFGFQGALGYYMNPEMKDVYVRARFFQPRIGRWLSVDPLLNRRGPDRYTVQATGASGGVASSL